MADALTLDQEVREIELDEPIGTLDVEIDDDGGQLVGEIDVDESEQPKPERKYGGGLIEDQTYLEQADPISNWEKVKRFLSKHDDPAGS